MQDPEPADLEQPDGDYGEGEQEHDEEKGGAVVRVDYFRARVARVQLHLGQKVGLGRLAKLVRNRADVFLCVQAACQHLAHLSDGVVDNVEQGVARAIVCSAPLRHGCRAWECCDRRSDGRGAGETGTDVRARLSLSLSGTGRKRGWATYVSKLGCIYNEPRFTRCRLTLAVS